MKIEAIVDHFDNEMASVPEASGSLATVHRRARRRRIVSGMTSGATALLVILVVVSLLFPSLPRIARADGPDAPTRLLIDGDVEILVTDNPIAEVENVARSLTVYGGLEAPAADFDLAELGQEQPLVQEEPRWDPTTDPGDVPVVYVGDVAGRAVFLHTNGAISLFDRILHEIADGQPFGPHLCLTVGDTSLTGGGGFCTGPGSTPEQRSTSGFLTQDGLHVGDFVTWFGLPSGTAVVTLEFDTGDVLWQRPYGDTVLFDLGGVRPGPTKLIALSTEGEVLHEVQVEVQSTS